jgi:hypothetical protein
MMVGYVSVMKGTSMTKKREESRWIKASGEETRLFPNGKKWSLKEMQNKVGGYVEMIFRTSMSQDYVMVVNEEGRLCGLPVNQQASEVAGRMIVGDVLIVPRKEIQ